MAAHVTRMTVQGLFDKHDYDLELSATDPGRPPLNLIYGRNGAGKSTLLRLLFHGVSSRQDVGHRSSLLRMPFQRASIYFDDGDSVTYTREIHGRSISFTIETNVNGEQLTETVTTLRRMISLDEVDDGAGTPAAAIGSLKIDPVIVTDAREIASDLLRTSEASEESPAHEYRMWSARQNLDQLMNTRRNEDLFAALSAVEEFLRSKAYQASREGLGQVDQAYVDVVRGIVTTQPKAGRPAKATVPSLISRIERLTEASRGYISYGLMQDFQGEALLAALRDALDRNGPLLLAILAPYLEGMEQRLQSMRPIYETLDTYVRSVNGFFEGKALVYRVDQNEVTFADFDSGQEIAAVDLSSGEKQLVMLLSYVTAMRESTRLIIIDEPEISLNPDWQRKLVPALVRLAEGTNIQLILATHSIEILAPYEDHVVELRDSHAY